MRSTEKAALRFQPTKAIPARMEKEEEGKKSNLWSGIISFRQGDCQILPAIKKEGRGERKWLLKEIGLPPLLGPQGELSRGESPKNVPLLPVCTCVPGNHKIERSRGKE